MSLSSFSTMTLKDLSQLSGFSVSTVSKALNNKFDISPSTRKAIQKIADQHNYVPNNYAVALRKKQTKAIAVIIPQINTNFYSCFLYNIEKVASKYGYRILVFQSFEEKKREKECLKSINDGSVDGAILVTKNSLNSLRKPQNHSLPIQCVQLSEEIQEKELKQNCMQAFSELLASFIVV
ncbi:HTH-type transcriptional regulator DegA [Kordia sp. SMS9]|uniref:LacI family DNA-binding transcriptional regulator n=1 Tax=Kordia sp. SMS9 TaxID=2282170 RepID=UPI000E0CD305|nr:LacI family DNA-binding transcriptional regulator [Kordia sp. SMS9]AXG68170.1 HTH-type transcriptional regulator DegA [Kordia sp. SMS9]